MINRIFYTVRYLSYNNFKEFRNYKINNVLKNNVLNKKKSIDIETQPWPPFNDKSCLCGNPINKCNLNNKCPIRNKRED